MTNSTIVSLRSSPSGRSIRLSLSSGEQVLLPVDIVASKHLGIGTKFGPDLFEVSQLYQLQEYALRSLSLSSQLEKPLRYKLLIYSKKHQFPSHLIDQVISYINQHNLIDEVDYIKNYQLKSPQKSIQRLKYELGIKGVSRQLLDRYLISTPSSQLDSAQAFIRKKHPTLQKLTDPHQKQLILSSFIRNGFSYSVAKSAIDAYLKSL
jgi:SOS response regulatory protein OraA/RecX